MPMQVRIEEERRSKLSVLADCGIASTAKRKLVSLLYCRTSYTSVHGEYGDEWREIVNSIMNFRFP